MFSGPDISENVTDTAETGSTGIVKIDSEKLDTDTGVKDQGNEDIKMLLEELIRRVIDSDKIGIIGDDLHTNVLKSDTTEQMEVTDSGEIARNVNIDNSGCQGIHNETITTSLEVDSLKPEASITLIDNAESIEPATRRDFDVSDAKGKLNSDITLCKNQETGDTGDKNSLICDSNVISDTDIDAEIMYEKVLGVKHNPETGRRYEKPGKVHGTCTSVMIVKSSNNGETELSVSSDIELIDKAIILNSEAIAPDTDEINAQEDLATHTISDVKPCESQDVSESVLVNEVAIDVENIESNRTNKEVKAQQKTVH